MTRVRLAAIVVLWVAVLAPRPALAQRSVTDVLSFLLTNRSIPTDDAALDQAAAEATRDTNARFQRLELATLPTISSSTGFIR